MHKNPPLSSSLGPKLDRWDVVALGGVTIMWMALFMTGRPLPFVDDIFFTGTAINLVKHQTFENPWVSDWMRQFGTQQFYIQPPFHPIFLAAWLRIDGISTASVLAYTDFFGLLISSGIYILFRLGGSLRLVAVFGAILSASFILCYGLRHDADGLALVVLASIFWMRSGYAFWFLGCVLGAMAPATAPFQMTLIVPIGVWRLFRTSNGERFGQRLAVAVAALVFVMTLFALSIHGHFRAFWTVFHRVATMRTCPSGHHLEEFYDALTVGREWMLQGPIFVLLLGAIVLRGVSLGLRGVGMVLVTFSGFVGLGIWFYPWYAAQYTYFAATLVTAYLLSNSKLHSRLQRVLLCALLAIFSIHQFSDCVAACYLRSGNKLNLERLRSEAAAVPACRLMVDQYAIRYVYGFNLPDGAVDWVQYHLAPPLNSHMRDKPANVIWLVHSMNLEACISDSGVHAERVHFLGQTFSTKILDPEDIRMIR
jgi:hypothetical protein